MHEIQMCFNCVYNKLVFIGEIDHTNETLCFETYFAVKQSMKFTHIFSFGSRHGIPCIWALDFVQTIKWSQDGRICSCSHIEILQRINHACAVPALAIKIGETWRKSLEYLSVCDRIGFEKEHHLVQQGVHHASSSRRQLYWQFESFQIILVKSFHR